MIAAPTAAVDDFVYSMVWVQDDGIKAYFKQLPAFAAIIKGKPSVAARLAMSRSVANNLNNQLISAAVMAANVELEQFDIEIMSKEGTYL